MRGPLPDDERAAPLRSKPASAPTPGHAGTHSVLDGPRSNTPAPVNQVTSNIGRIEPSEVGRGHAEFIGPCSSGLLVPAAVALGMLGTVAVVLGIVVALIVVALFASQRRKRPEPPAITVEVRSRTRSEPDEAPPEPREVEPGTWLVNPGFAIELHVLSIGRPVVDELAGLLREAIGSYDHRLSARLTALVAKSNLRCREIDHYVAQNRPAYQRRLNDLTAASPEWSGASAPDREDLLSGFRDEALGAVHVRPDVDLVTLFECEPSDRTIDDQLVDAFGFDDINIYLRHVAKPGKVHRIEAENHRRPFFERLVERGLAVRGKDIPLAAVLDTLKLKEMQALAEGLDAPTFRRKALAIDFLTSVPDLARRLDSAVGFRELFQLRPLPPPFDGIDLDAVARAWTYDAVIAELLQRTYVMGYYGVRNRRDDLGGFVKQWRVSAIDDERCCPYCQEVAQKRFPGGKPPRTPLHLACRCCVMMER